MKMEQEGNGQAVDSVKIAGTLQSDRHRFEFHHFTQQLCDLGCPLNFSVSYFLISKKENYLLYPWGFYERLETIYMCIIPSGIQPMSDIGGSLNTL